ncbi:unnamed protein product [Hermetia illucens]|uniref:Uncharacterized protein n=1 Tax=Hermetia illucens TaxID=343691 RepID=A0A7R8YUQ6_HERIL|nr:drosulfakinins [Hermetia illucens]CAD7086057.1 unnamed protein product [Hermetia illucens]
MNNLAISLTVLFCLICASLCVLVASEKSETNGKMFQQPHRANGAKRNVRFIYGFDPKAIQLARFRADPIFEEDDSFERLKGLERTAEYRLQDKRAGEDQFDDYGHMRFGRSFSGSSV